VPNGPNDNVLAICHPTRVESTRLVIVVGIFQFPDLLEKLQPTWRTQFKIYKLEKQESLTLKVILLEFIGLLSFFFLVNNLIANIVYKKYSYANNLINL